MGGTIAYEMAQQLEHLGHKTQLLELLDTYYYWGKYSNPGFYENLHFLFEKTQFQWLNFKKVGLNNWWVFSMEKGRIAYRNIRDRFSDMKITLPIVENIYIQAANKYKPIEYSGQVVLFCPSEQYSRYHDLVRGFQSLISGDLFIQEIPAYPGGMLVEPFVQQLAEQLIIFIDLALEKDSTNNR